MSLRRLFVKKTGDGIDLLVTPERRLLKSKILVQTPWTEITRWLYRGLYRQPLNLDAAVVLSDEIDTCFKGHVAAIPGYDFNFINRSESSPQIMPELPPDLLCELRRQDFIYIHAASFFATVARQALGRRVDVREISGAVERENNLIRRCFGSRRTI
ncbi:MAG TPA: hypothetical protein VEL78_05425 [Pyrinomonadaceae bacterium]|nr:hypothetical protein [Pyrinomonadaceae bacterium]